MDPDTTLEPYIERFHCYVDDVARTCRAGNGGLELKRRHSLRVLREAEHLTRVLDLDRRTSFLIHLAALYHDLGRFEQIRRYNTLSDRRSINHARESVHVIKRLDLLSALAGDERRLVMGAVYLHNYRVLPRHLKPGLLLAARVLRDADKIDIVSVILSYVEGESQPDTDIYLHLVRDPRRYSRELLEPILAGQVLRLDAVTYANDFLLLLCSWVHDLNFESTKSEFRKRNYLDRVFAHLPQEPPLHYLKDRLGENLATN